MNGTVYSFERGDVQFLVINFEDWKTEGYLEALGNWMRSQAAGSQAKWRIAAFHRNMFTGSRNHQDDKEGIAIRDALLPVFDELGIDIALEGHDHIYEVIGPVNNKTKTLVEGAVEMVEEVTPSGVRENMTGKQGGVFNVAEGTLYFLNNSAGKKKYEPRTQEQMEEAVEKHNIDNYWGLFSGKFGQTGEPTFSKVSVTADALTFSTYTVDDFGIPTLFDSFKVIKEKSDATAVSEAKTPEVSIRQNGNSIIVEGLTPDELKVYAANGTLVASFASAIISTKGLPTGVYIVQAKAGNRTYTSKVTL